MSVKFGGVVGLNFNLFLVSLFVKLTFFNFNFALSAPIEDANCEYYFSDSSHYLDIQLSEDELLKSLITSIGDVEEFEEISSLAQQRGLRVWLFGGTSATFVHYQKMDLLRKRKLLSLAEERFDFEFTNIFKSSQDIDLVIDGTAEEALEFQKKIDKRFPYKTKLNGVSRWEVRTLKFSLGEFGTPGYKEALINNSQFSNQNSDSNSLSLFELTDPPEGKTRVTDLRSLNAQSSVFLEDVLSNKITFFDSSEHFSTERYKAGENPKILSVIRYLAKLFQFGLDLDPESRKKIVKIIDEFDPNETMSEIALQKISKTGIKLVINASNIEKSFDLLDELGLREKLTALDNKNIENSLSWWLSKEPLRSKKLGQGTGKTADELGIDLVSHETGSLAAFESITGGLTMHPNTFISRDGVEGETANFGEGFYTLVGKRGVTGKEHSLSIQFRVNPGAREGSDFRLVVDDSDVSADTQFIVLNKEILSVVPDAHSLALDSVRLLYKSTARKKLVPVQLGYTGKVLSKATYIHSGYENRTANHLATFEKYKPKFKSLIPRLVNDVFQNGSAEDQLSVIELYVLSLDRPCELDQYCLDEETKFELEKTIEDHLFGSSSGDFLKLLANIEDKDFLFHLSTSSLLNKLAKFSTADHVSEEVNIFLEALLNIERAMKQNTPKSLVAHLITNDNVEVFSTLFGEDGPLDPALYRLKNGYSPFLASAMVGSIVGEKSSKILRWLVFHSSLNFDEGSEVLSDVISLKDSFRLTDVFEQLTVVLELDKPPGFPNFSPYKFMKFIPNEEFNNSQFSIFSAPISMTLLRWILALVDSYGSTYKSFLDTINFVERHSKKYHPDVLKDVCSSTRGVLEKEYPRLPVDCLEYLIHAINFLSIQKNPRVQNTMKYMFDEHESGDQYRIPTEDEWLQMVTLNGVFDRNDHYGTLLDVKSTVEERRSVPAFHINGIPILLPVEKTWALSLNDDDLFTDERHSGYVMRGVVCEQTRIRLESEGFEIDRRTPPSGSAHLRLVRD